VVTKYFELVFTGSIEMKSVKPKQTADNNSVYKIYLLEKVQCLGHGNVLTHIYICLCVYVYTMSFTIFVGDLTTCQTQYTWDISICIFCLIEQISKFLLHNLQVLYMYILCDSNGLFEMIVGVLTINHIQYTWDTILCIFI
jgi:hypothetical protein